jgi:arylsulfatase A-like enzyme
VIPHVASPESAAKQRLQRGIEIPIDTSAAAGGPVSLSVDLTDAMRDTWDDVRRDGRLLGLEIDFVGGDPETARLQRLELHGELARFSGAAGGHQRSVSLGDVIRPTLFAHAGARVRVSLTLPEGAPELRWHDGALGSPGSRRVDVIQGDSRKTIATTDPGGRAEWEAQRASLSAWAGQRVTIELISEASPDRRAGVGLFATPAIVAGAPPLETPDVILYLVDTLRADRLGAYGHEAADVSPNLDRLASEGVLFERLISSSSWTKPAIPTLMTGIWPTTHRVGATSNTDELPAAVPVLQERLAKAGWRAGSFTANPLGSTLSGLERGFGTAFPPRYWQGRVGPLGHPSAAQLHDALVSWIDEQPNRPFFAYVHTVEVHEYHRPMYKEHRSGLRPYDAAVQDADRKLGDLMQTLRELGRDRNLILAVVSDHGESLGEHGLVGHGMSLYQQELHVPFILWAGGAFDPRRVDDLASIADIAPTLLDLVGVDPIEGVDGRSLAPAATSVHAIDRSFVPAALMRVLWRLGAPREHAVLTADGTKLIRSESGSEQAYDLLADPGELSPLPSTPAGAARALDGWMATEREQARIFEATFGPVGSTEMDRDDAERLRALGYIE